MAGGELVMDPALAIILIVLVGAFAFVLGAAIQHYRVEGERTKQINLREQDKQERLKRKIEEEVQDMTSDDMMADGWCDGCDGNYDECKKLGRCKGDIYREETDTYVLNNILNKLKDKGGKNEQ